MAEVSVEQQALKSIGFTSVILLCVWRIKSNLWVHIFLVYSIQAATRYWQLLVNLHVPLPYLDEYFHIPQALAYWNGQWTTWDPKITTPPALYLVTYPWLYLCSLTQQDGGFTFAVRSVSNITLAGLSFVVNTMLRSNMFWKKHGTTAIPETSFESLKIAQVAFNVCLFPPLFFFSALYYTDIPSVLSVLVTFTAFIHGTPSLVVFSGLISLMFRQTNIFWVAVYLGGEEVVRSLKKRPQNSDSQLSREEAASILSVGRCCWERGAVYDPLVREAFFEDYLKTVISVGLSALVQIHHLVVPLIPYVSLLIAFGAFVVWNGGVVLGDKENHIASIHLMQMFYIWPYLTFFSFPILLPSLVPTLLALLPQNVIAMLPEPLQPPNSARTSFPRPIIFVPMLAAALTTIHYNTLVHPFTLADNRHYTFYVFRLLLRHPWTKYLVAPLYVFFGWACIDVLGAIESSGKPVQQPKKRGNTKSNVRMENTENHMDQDGVRVSFVLLWILASTLCLASTPLVEPRYFILPWIVWRLQVPTRSISGLSTMKKIGGTTQQTGMKGSWIEVITAELTLSYPLYLEMFWFLVVNFCTGYMFLFRGFKWPSEPGAVQRFMW